MCIRDRYLTTTFTCFIFSLLTYAQNTDFTKLDSLFTILEENNRFFGSVAVSQGNEIIYTKAIGFADLDAKVANDKDTKFRIGSISKTFTATLLMKAIELGKVNLDDTIDTYFPGIINADQITVRHLLNHRSGIANFTDRNYMNWHTESITQAALLDTIITKGIDFKPDEDFTYSNSNYVLLTFILEKIFDEPYEQILDEHIVKALGLANTKYGSAINVSENEAKSYHMKSDWKEHSQDDMSIPLGAGGIVSTPSDLCLFIKALFNGKLISSASLDQMKPVGDAWYGFALYGTPFHNNKGWGHGGNIDAFASNLIYFEESDISIALSCNGSNYGSHDVEIAILSELFGKAYDLPSFDFVELDSEELDQYLGTYVTDELPMDMIVTKEENTLYLEATGQSASALTAEGNHKFSILKYGVKMTFVPEQNKLHFEQQGMAFELERKTAEPSEAFVSEQSNPDTPAASSDLDQFVGTYVTDEIPIDITISQDLNTLYIQVPGQTPGALKAEGDDKFSIEEYGVKIQFVPGGEVMLFEQQGMAFEFVKKADD